MTIKTKVLNLRIKGSKVGHRTGVFLAALFISVMAFSLTVQTADSKAFASETVDGAKKDLESFKQEMSARLDKIEKDLDQLKEKTKTKSNTASEKSMKDLETARDQVQAKLNKLKDDGKDSWKKFKVDLSKSVDDLNHRLQEALKD